MLIKLAHFLVPFLFFSPAFAQSPTVEPFPEALEARQERVLALIHEIGAELETTPQQRNLAWKIIKCENPELDPTLQSRIKANGPNGREDSWGLVQIHAPSHPSILPQQATNPEFAVRFLLQNIKDGNQKIWSCNRLVNSP